MYFLNKTADSLQKSAVRLLKRRTLSPTEMPRHFSTLGSMETGKKNNPIVDTRHTLTQFGDWNGPNRPPSTGAQGTVVRVPI